MEVRTCMVLVLFLHPSIFGLTAAQDEDTTLDALTRALDRTLAALERGLGFLERNYRDLNLDGVIGPRMVEGQLEVLLEKERRGNLPEGTLRTLRALQAQAGVLSDAAVPHVNASQPKYYARLGALIEKDFWRQDHPSRDLEADLVSKPLVDGEAMDEQDSDDCLYLLLGSDTSPACRVSRFCWKLMTSPGYRGYSLSHQLFYMLIAEARGCVPRDVAPLVDALSSGFCSNMMVQAQTIAHQHFPPHSQDLFMEIQSLCGVAGFHEMFRQDWLQQILSWQRKPEGCWGHDMQGGRAHKTKREERVLGGSCLAHQSSVAVGALAQNVRYLLEQLYPRTS